MAELQQFFTQWVNDVALLLPFGFAFGAGMVSTVNPCGFAMLPAYLGLFLRSPDHPSNPSPPAMASGGSAVAVAVPTQLARAILVAAVVTVGFALLFGAVGIVISAGGRFIVTAVPWIALGIGVLLALLGVALLRGYHLSANFAAQLAGLVGEPGAASVKGFFIFGVAYATASLSCTLPIFLTVVGGSLAVSSFAASVAGFLSYALGMGLVILVLTIGIAVFKGAVVGKLQKALPYVERVSALLLIIAGSYIVYYWLFKGRLIETFV